MLSNPLAANRLRRQAPSVARPATERQRGAGAAAGLPFASRLAFRLLTFSRFRHCRRNLTVGVAMLQGGRHSARIFVACNSTCLHAVVGLVSDSPVWGAESIVRMRRRRAIENQISNRKTPQKDAIYGWTGTASMQADS